MGRVSYYDIAAAVDVPVGTVRSRLNRARLVDVVSGRSAKAVQDWLEAPTLIVWGTGDHFFDVRWVYWLRDTIPGAERVVEIEEAKLFFPDERAAELAVLLREDWRAPVASHNA